MAGHPTYHVSVIKLTEGFLRYEFGGLIFGGAEKIAGAFLTACSNSSISNKTLKKLLERKKVPSS